MVLRIFSPGAYTARLSVAPARAFCSSFQAFDISFLEHKYFLVYPISNCSMRFYLRHWRRPQEHGIASVIFETTIHVVFCCLGDHSSCLFNFGRIYCVT